MPILQSFQQTVLEQLDIYMQKNRFTPPTSYHIQKLIKSKSKTIKLLEGHISIGLHDFKLGNGFLDMT